MYGTCTVYLMSSETALMVMVSFHPHSSHLPLNHTSLSLPATIAMKRRIDKVEGPSDAQLPAVSRPRLGSANVRDHTLPTKPTVLSTASPSLACSGDEVQLESSDEVSGLDQDVSDSDGGLSRPDEVGHSPVEDTSPTRSNANSSHHTLASDTPGWLLKIPPMDMSRVDALKARMRELMPRIQVAAAQYVLEESQSMEDVSEDEAYIEMNLGLGVLEEVNGSGESDSDDGSDESCASEEGEDEKEDNGEKKHEAFAASAADSAIRSKFAETERDVMRKLMGRPRTDRSGCIEEVE